MSHLLLVGLLGAHAAVAASLEGVATTPRITIIIDDLGYSLRAGQRAVRLPGPVVCAVLPQTPRARALAELAASEGKEVLLHLPLQASAVQVNAAPGHITLDMSRRAMAETLETNLDSVPFVIGVNGHQGSLLTRHPGHMRWLMEEIVARRLLFVDSYTTHLSVALDAARELGVPAARRDVFLDADPAPAEIAREFARLKGLARAQGSAIGIGHPHATTLDFLERELPGLREQGFELVGIRRLLSERHAAAMSRRYAGTAPGGVDSTEPAREVRF